MYLEHYLPRPAGVSPIGAGSGSSRSMLGGRSSTAGGLGAAGRAALGGLGSSSTGAAFSGALQLLRLCSCPVRAWHMRHAVASAEAVSTCSSVLL
jgi:hypothetical protein